jgi:hypothetical protein
VLFWEKVSLTNKNNSNSVSLRGHTSNLVTLLNNKSRDKYLYIYGGVCGFNKYSDKIYKICLKVY